MSEQEVTLKMSLMKEEKARNIKTSKHFRKKSRNVVMGEAGRFLPHGSRLALSEIITRKLYSFKHCLAHYL